MKYVCIAVACVFVSLCATPAFAQEEVEKAPETHYDFADDEIEGELVQAGERIVGDPSQKRRSSLIEVRSDFMPEVIKSAESL